MKDNHKAKHITVRTTETVQTKHRLKDGSVKMCEINY